ncbi:hypothetical protein V6N13_021150 [Hibiscus sabdariffa]|uniref:Uncharacterized protein n=1 Tax=Hibiscus sabdariffa TaxID=183260 RepID=A0ABR1ZPR3_9ROSI
MGSRNNNLKRIKFWQFLATVMSATFVICGSNLPPSRHHFRPQRLRTGKLSIPAILYMMKPQLLVLYHRCDPISATCISFIVIQSVYMDTYNWMEEENKWIVTINAEVSCSVESAS